MIRASPTGPITIFLFCLESVYDMSQILLKGPAGLGRF
jgi:hypothetical protein